MRLYYACPRTTIDSRGTLLGGASRGGHCLSGHRLPQEVATVLVVTGSLSEIDSTSVLSFNIIYTSPKFAGILPTCSGSTVGRSGSPAQRCRQYLFVSGQETGSAVNRGRTAIFVAPRTVRDSVTESRTGLGATKMAILTIRFFVRLTFTTRSEGREWQTFLRAYV